MHLVAGRASLRGPLSLDSADAGALYSAKMTFDEPIARIRLGPLWLLFVSLLLLAVNLFLLLSLSLSWGTAMLVETSLAAALFAFGLARMLQGRKPTPLHLLLWTSLVAVWLMNPLRSQVFDAKVERVGTERLLLDARALAGEVGRSLMQAEELDPENLLVPQSMRDLEPELVLVRLGYVELVYDRGFSSIEAVVIDTDPKIVPGPVTHQPAATSQEPGWDWYSSRSIAPGIHWYSAGT